MDMQRRNFEVLVLPHLDAAYNLARWLSRSETEAEDIVQEATLRALKSLHGLRGVDAKPWFLTIVRNCYRSAQIRQCKFPIVALDDEFEASRNGRVSEPLISNDPDPETNAATNADRRKLDSLLASMPEAFREVLILREWEELSYREIAGITSVPIGTVMSRLARARELLKQRWQETEDTRP